MIRLEPLQREDFHNIIEWNKGRTSDFLLQWAGPSYEYPITEQQIEDYFNETNANEGREMAIYKIVLEENGKMVGSFQIREDDKDSNTGRVGRFIIDEAFRGKGIGKEALTQLMQIGFESLHYDIISLGVFDFNSAAIACYETVGFEKYKLVEKARAASDGYWNLYDMKITREKWNLKKQK
ncbi:MAG: GNAT family protein [Bacillota bacterium]|nr:GNAT family protein [Bacillota bacterium]